MSKVIINEALWDKLILQSKFKEDIAYAKKNFFHKSDEKILEGFGKNGGAGYIGRTDELRKMPNILFNYYIHYFIRFILEVKHDPDEKEGIASCFLTLLEQKIESKSITEESVIKGLFKALKFLETDIENYNEFPDIFGNLSEKIDVLKSNLDKQAITSNS